MAKAELSTEQSELVGQFADLSFEQPRLDFDAVAKKLGADFPRTPNGRLFRNEATTVFDQERQ